MDIQYLIHKTGDPPKPFFSVSENSSFPFTN